MDKTGLSTPSIACLTLRVTSLSQSARYMPVRMSMHIPCMCMPSLSTCPHMHMLVSGHNSICSFYEDVLGMQVIISTPSAATVGWPEWRLF